ncbi:hypothetical protein BH11MYX1_BH11MYX1_29760 [soil metagenome]
MRTVVLILVLAACGNNNSEPSDAAKSIDARPPDALLDAPPPPASAHRFVLDHERLPSSNNQARAYSLDLNNDGTADNGLGMALASLSSMGFDVQAPLDRAIDTGTIEILADIETTDLVTSTQATVALLDGANALPTPCLDASDIICRHHLAGTSTFDVATTSHDTPLTGAIVTGVLDAGPGALHLRTVVFGAPVDLALIGARVRLQQPSDAAIMTGIVAGAITQAEIDTSLIPAIQTGVSAQIALDCSALTSPPECGCTTGSGGKSLLVLFDTNQDCVVSNAEIKSNSLITVLLAPDVSINSVQALSFGVQVSAVHAAFTP